LKKNLSQRQIVMLLNALAIQQDLARQTNPDVPSSLQFSKHEEAKAIAIRAINSGQELVYFGEFDELFTQLVEEHNALDGKLEGKFDLASLPASGIYH
jgi:hypothetical protein